MNELPTFFFRLLLCEVLTGVTPSSERGLLLLTTSLSGLCLGLMVGGVAAADAPMVHPLFVLAALLSAFVAPTGLVASIRCLRRLPEATRLAFGCLGVNASTLALLLGVVLSNE